MSFNPKRYTAGLLFAIVASVIFGLIPLFSVPLIQAGMSVPSIVCYRFALSTCIMGALLFFQKESIRVSIKELGSLFCLSVCYALTALLLTSSYQYIPSGIATTIHFLYPVWVCLLTLFLFKDKVSKSTLVAMVAAILGVALLSLSGTHNHHISGKGILIVLGTVVAYGSYLAWLPKSAVKNMNGMKVTFWLMGCCTVIFTLNILFTKGIHGFNPVPDTPSWINLLLVSLLPTLVSNLTLIQAIKRIGPTATSILGCLEPFTAVIIGIVVFHEHCTALQLAGILIVISAVSLLIFTKSKSKANA